MPISRCKKRQDGVPDMESGGDQFDVRSMDQTHPRYLWALHRVLDLKPPTPGGAPAPQVAKMLDDNARQATDANILLGAYHNEQLVGVCLAVTSPGAAAMVFAPSLLAGELEVKASIAALCAVRTAVWKRSPSLLEVLVPPNADRLAQALTAAGFHRLTRLVYLLRPHIRKRPTVPVADDLEWVQYTPDREALFLRTLEATYLQSLDCPELTGSRKIEEVLAGHRATGVFDPTRWWVATRNGKPVGLILLSLTSQVGSVEIVYVGVAPEARGTGVANALLDRAVDLACELGDKELALAVDERNAPARRMYARWSFAEIGVREAWIARPPMV